MLICRFPRGKPRGNTVTFKALLDDNCYSPWFNCHIAVDFAIARKCVQLRFHRLPLVIVDEEFTRHDIVPKAESSADAGDDAFLTQYISRPDFNRRYRIVFSKKAFCRFRVCPFSNMSIEQAAFQRPYRVFHHIGARELVAVAE